MALAATATPGAVSDDDRQKLAAALTAALLLIYAGHAHAAMTDLAATGATLGIATDAYSRIQDFAAHRAGLVQDGTNRRLQAALDALPPDASEQDQQQAIQRVLDDAHQHNIDRLAPYFAAWAAQQALSDSYAQSIMPDGQTAKDATQWVWTRNTNNPPQDECQDAADAGPASYDDLVGLAGSPPPVHENCACSLDPINE